MSRRELPYSPWSWIDRKEGTLLESIAMEGYAANVYAVPARGTSGPYLLSAETPAQTLLVISSPPLDDPLADSLDELVAEAAPPGAGGPGGGAEGPRTVLVDVFDSKGQAAYSVPSDCVRLEPFVSWALVTMRNRLSPAPPTHVELPETSG